MRREDVLQEGTALLETATNRSCCSLGPRLGNQPDPKFQHRLLHLSHEKSARFLLAESLLLLRIRGLRGLTFSPLYARSMEVGICNSDPWISCAAVSSLCDESNWPARSST